jgi:uncharacterized protein (DUF1501 family)
MSDDHQPIDLRVEQAALAGCEEARTLVSRRAAMGITAGFFSWAFAPGFAEAGTRKDPRLLVVVLRGGLDGLNTVVPLGDPRYAPLRADLAIDKNQTLALSGMFGLNNAMKKFHGLYKAKQAAVVHATCVPLRVRSHFECQDNLENGLPGEGPTVARSGWLNRVMAALPAGSPVNAGGAIQIGGAPLILHGRAPVLGWSQTWFGRPEPLVDNVLTQLYAETDAALLDQYRKGLAANALATGSDAGDGGGDSTLQRTFSGAGRLMKAAKGPRVAVISVGGFDTHTNQVGTMSYLLGDLDAAIDRYRQAMGPAWKQAAVVCVTEFGRTASVNGTYGTDHGTGTVALLAGGAIRGGRVFGKWPGLASRDLLDGRDLRPTTDLRAVFKGLLADHLGLGRATLDIDIFPGSQDVAPMRGLIRG